MVVTSLPPPTLAALPDYPTIGDSLLFQLNGLIVVFIALGSIWGLLEIMGWFFRRTKPSTPSPAAASSLPPATAGASTPPPADHIPPELLAVISAAVHVATAGRPHRIAAIVPAPLESELDWAREGRRTIFASHKTR